MSDTQGLKTRVEDAVRARLEEIYGKKFKKGALPVGTRSDGTKAEREFDAIAEDGSIVASIKANSWKTAGGNFPAAKSNSFYVELYFFGLIGKGPKKLLVFTEAETRDGFATVCDGKKPDDVEFVHIHLDLETQRFAESIRKAASREIKTKSRAKR